MKLKIEVDLNQVSFKWLKFVELLQAWWYTQAETYRKICWKMILITQFSIKFKEFKDPEFKSRSDRNCLGPFCCEAQNLLMLNWTFLFPIELTLFRKVLFRSELGGYGMSGFLFTFSWKDQHQHHLGEIYLYFLMN